MLNRITVMTKVLACTMLLPLVSISPLVAQNRDTECRGVVRAIYGKMSGAADASKICRITYKVRTVTRLKGKSIETVADVELVANRNRMWMVTEEMEVHQDASTAVMIMPGKKTIYIKRSNLAQFRESRGKMLSMMQDSLLALSDVSECTDVADRSLGSDRRITFQLRSRAQRSLRIRSFTLFLDTKAQAIRKIVVVPDGTNGITALDVTLGDIDYDYRPQAFNAPLLSNVLDPQGNLLAKYRGYELVDLRNVSLKR